MSRAPRTNHGSLSLSVERRLDEVCNRFENAWAAGQQPAIETYLGEVPEPEKSELLTELIRIEVYYRRLGGEDPRPADYQQRFPSLDETWLAQEFTGRPASMPDSPTVPAAAAPRPSGCGASADAPVPASRYRPLRFHAKGALGEVFVARDEELHRQVALKRIQRPGADNPEYRRRFLVEAELTARLEHPGIVPVYGLVQGADGQPCYAMRFIQGESLREAIERFHAADKPGRDAGERSLALRQLLSRFLTVCNTVAYAHSRGVLHRDLKPANIMLGKYGETLVVDWGLAKTFKRDPSTAVGEEEALAPTLTGPTSKTQVGQVIGTPAYMSPEQAAGRGDLVGPASDIYSLGATLYTILTGQIPFRGSQKEVLARVQQGEILALRHGRKQIPRALEAICRKAMARQPEQRYATALEIATDLEHWLADEPVNAWREPWTLRTRRWIGKHRTLVTAVAATVLVAMVSLAVATGLLGEAYRQAEISRQGERQAKELAERNFNLAKKNSDLAVKTLTDVVLDFQMKLSHIPAAREVREAWLQRVLQDLQEVGRTLETSAQADRTSMAAHAQMGDIFLTAGGTGKAGLADVSRDRKELGWTQEARWHYQRALAIAQELTAAEPTSALAQRDLAQSYHRLGDLYRNLGETPAAREAYRQALDIFKALAEADSTGTQAQLDLGRGYNRLGDICLQLGELEAAHNAYRQALTIHQALAKTDATNPLVQSALGVSYNVLGDILARRRQLPAAHEAYCQAAAIGQELIRANPASASAHRHLTLVWGKLVDIRLQLGQSQAAADACRQALRISQSWAKDDPKSVEAQRYLAMAFLRLGMVRLQLGERPAARDAYRQALDSFTTLAKDDPTNVLAQRNLALAYSGFGDVNLELGKAPLADEAYRHAWDILARLSKSDPGNAQFLMDLVITCSKLGNLAQEMKEFTEAGEWYGRGLTILRTWEQEGKLKSQPQMAQQLQRLEQALAEVTEKAKPESQQRVRKPREK